MVMQNVIRYSLLSLACGFFLLPAAQAQVKSGAEMFVCTSSEGVRTYQNSDGGSGCVPLNLNPITVVPSPKSSAPRGHSSGTFDSGASASSGGGGSYSGGSSGSGESGSSSSRRATAAYDSRTSGDFNAKDDRMKILQEELRIEEGKLKSLQDEYKSGQPDRQGNEKNYQKYLDRVARLEQEIMVTNDNIEILKTELVRLSK